MVNIPLLIIILFFVSNFALGFKKELKNRRLAKELNDDSKVFDTNISIVSKFIIHSVLIILVIIAVKIGV